MVTSIGAAPTGIPALPAKSDSGPVDDRRKADQAALAALQAPRRRTEAETRLGEILNDLKHAGASGGAEAAQRKLERIRARLEALKLLAGTAAATGDPRSARALARQVRDLARELAATVRNAGDGSAGPAGAAAKADAGKVAPLTPQDIARQVGGTVGEGRAVDAAARAAAMVKALDGAAADAAPASPTAGVGAGDEVKAAAAGLLVDLRRLLIRGRAAQWHPLADPKDAGGLARDFQEAEAALAQGLALTLGRSRADFRV